MEILIPCWHPSPLPSAGPSGSALRTIIPGAGTTETPLTYSPGSVPRLGFITESTTVYRFSGATGGAPRGRRLARSPQVRHRVVHRPELLHRLGECLGMGGIRRLSVDAAEPVATADRGYGIDRRTQVLELLEAVGGELTPGAAAGSGAASGARGAVRRLSARASAGPADAGRHPVSPVSPPWSGPGKREPGASARRLPERIC